MSDLLSAPLVGSLRLQRLQLELRSHAIAAVRALLHGAAPPPSRPLLVLRALRPALVRRALWAYLSAEVRAHPDLPPISIDLPPDLPHRPDLP